MSETEEIIRIAAKGDGITASGRFAWGAAPGDLLLPDGTLERGGDMRGEAACGESGGGEPCRFPVEPDTRAGRRKRLRTRRQPAGDGAGKDVSRAGDG